MKVKLLKRILSLVLTILMVMSVFSICTLQSSAADTTGVNNRIAQIVSELKTKFPSGYFTANGSYGHDETTYGNCSLYGIVNSKYPELSSTISTKSSNGWDCAAFAKLMTVLLFGTCKDTNDRYIGSGSSASTYNQLRPGDLFYSEHPHWMIYISHDSTGVTVIDANGYGDQQIGYYRKYAYSNGNLSGNLMTWQSPHWDEVNSKYGGSSGGSSGTITTSMKKAIDVSDVSSSGYTVTCYVKSTASILRVQFPTWTDRNGQDDLLKTWVSSSYASGSYSGLTSDGYSIYRFRVYASDHNYETGTYHTHIYVYVSGLTEAAISGGTSVNVHNHSYSWVTDYSATCTSSGQQHQHCSVCGNNKNYTSISALGHNWNSWKVTTPATCTSSGVETRTCSRNSSHKETRTISALGHYWSTPTYTWSADNKTCTATRTCTRDSSHKETQTVNTTSQVLRQPTMTQTGTAKYTAVFSNSAFSTQTKNVSIPKTYDGFPDVKEGSWYYDAVKYCAQSGYMSGYQNGYFGPNDSLKRQDFVCILARIAKADLSGYQNSTSKFKDVKKGTYYAAAVNWAVDNGIINGYNNGKFGVNDNITREQIATILYNYKKSPSVSNPDNILRNYSDKDRISSYAKTPVAWAVQKKIISGMSDGRLAPTKSASRAEIAAIVMNMDKQGMFK